MDDIPYRAGGRSNEFLDYHEPDYHISHESNEYSNEDQQTDGSESVKKKKKTLHRRKTTRAQVVPGISGEILPSSSEPIQPDIIPTVVSSPPNITSTPVVEPSPSHIVISMDNASSSHHKTRKLKKKSSKDKDKTKVKKKKHKKSRRDSQDEGDDESNSTGTSDDGGSSAESSDDSAEREPPRNISKSVESTEGKYLDEELGSKPKQRATRPARFLLARTGPSSAGSGLGRWGQSISPNNAYSGIWGTPNIRDGSASSLDLTAAELAKLNGTQRRANGRFVPPIFERQKTVIEAALLPPGHTNPVSDSGSEIAHDDDHRDDASEASGHVLIPKYPLEELIPFLTLLATTFHSYGAPVNRTEWNMAEVSEALGVTATYSVMPTVITITFGLPDGMDAVSRTIRCDQGLDCGRMYLVEKLIDKIRAQKVNLYDAKKKLDEIIHQAPSYSIPVKLLCMSIASGSAAVLFFGGGWLEMLVSMLLGFIVGLLDLVSSVSLSFARVADIISALIVALVAAPVVAYAPGSCFSGLVLSSLVWLLPGLTLTLAVRELATRNMVAGTVRMFSAFMTSLKLGFGIAFGSQMAFWVQKSAITTPCTNPVNNWWYLPIFFTTVISFSILLDSNRTQWPGQIFASGIGFLISWAADKYLKLPAELTSVIAAFGVGLAGNIYSRYSSHPGVVYIFSGILLLVPGSVGVRGATAFFDKDAWSGLQFSFTMIIIGFSITVGTLVADLVIFPRRALIHHAM